MSFKSIGIYIDFVMKCLKSIKSLHSEYQSMFSTAEDIPHEDITNENFSQTPDESEI